MVQFSVFVFFQAEDGIRDLVRSRGLGDVYKRQADDAWMIKTCKEGGLTPGAFGAFAIGAAMNLERNICLLYTSDAADERSSVDLGGRRIIKKKQQRKS